MLRPLLVIALLTQGCALGAGAGLNLTVDTRGRVAIMATLSADPYAVRVEPKKSPDIEESISVLPLSLAVSGGVELNPGAGVLRIDGPGYCYTWTKIDGDEGVMGTLTPRFDLKWPFAGGFDYAIGGVLKGGWLKTMFIEKHDRVTGRPEWPDGWTLHQLGPVGEVAVMHDEDGVFAQFGVGVKFRYLNYFYMGL